MKEKLKEMEKLSEKIYNLSSVLKEYCKIYSNDIIEIENMYSLVECLHAYIDTLNNIFINMDLADENLS